MTEAVVARRPKPNPDPLTEPYWTGVSQRQLKLPFCEECGKAHFYPRSFCPHCGSHAIVWKEAGGRGAVYSYTVVQRVPSPAFAALAPYAVAIVALEEGPHLMASIVDCDQPAIAIGMEVSVDFLDTGDGLLPVFRPAGTAG